MHCCIFFFKQKTAYEMRISDWSSDVCSSDLDDAIPLPSFHHPRRAAYVLGRERGSLSDGLLARCDHVVRIPSRFSINLAIAGAMVMYDRMLCLGLFAPRPPRPGAPAAPVHLPAYPHPLCLRQDRTLAPPTPPSPLDLLLLPPPPFLSPSSPHFFLS